MTLTEGQGHKGEGQRSEKKHWRFSETIEDTDTKFGTKVLGYNVLHNISNTVTLTEGHIKATINQRELTRESYGLCLSCFVCGAILGGGGRGWRVAWVTI